MPRTTEDRRAEAVRLIGEGRFGAAASILIAIMAGERDLALLANLGHACQRTGAAGEAARIFRVCVERRREPAFLDGLGAALAALGRRDEAETCLAEAVARDPLLAGAWGNLARIGRLRRGDPLRDRLWQHARDPHIPASQRRRLVAVLVAVDTVPPDGDEQRTAPA
jgi:Flp pilus assembly protein TadD